MILRLRGATLLFILSAIGCNRASEEGDAPTSVNVRTIVVTAATFDETIGSIGTVSARPGHIATLSAPLPTRVTQVNASEGAHVAAGAPIIVFEKAVVDEARRSAEAKVTAAQHAYDRARTLSEAGILPRKDVEQASAELAAARSDLVAARRTAQLSVLRSPISGTVTRMSATLGASVDANQPLVEIVDPSALDIILGMTPTDAGRIRVGDKVELRSGQSRAGAPLGVGTVREIAAVVDSATRNVSVRVAAPTASRPLKVGETVYGDVVVATRPNVITIPVEAIVPDGDKFKVFVVDANNMVHSTDVTVGSRDETRAEIKGGLTVGSRIVTYGAYGLEDGATVVFAK
jgi:cobalt-zinc-cadmium efflux system membrane fusion protein